MSSNLHDKKIGILLGGDSSERDISLLSGNAVYDALINEGLNVVKVDMQGNALASLKNMHIDVAFIALHGRGGEDGRVQSMCERLGIPYTGSDARSSYNAFNKLKTKELLSAHKIPVPAYAVITASTWQKKMKNFTLPVFIKPISDGSSIGVFLVRSMDELTERLKDIFKSHRNYLVEERIEGREITVGIVGEQALPIIELKSTNTFYDYAAKYTAGKTAYLMPAEFPRAAYKHYQALALKTHRVLGARDFSRVDMMVDRTGQAYILELNSIPGLTTMSLLPKAAQYTGLEFGTLCTKLLQCALKRGTYGTQKKKKRGR